MSLSKSGEEMDLPVEEKVLENHIHDEDLGTVLSHRIQYVCTGDRSRDKQPKHQDTPNYCDGVDRSSILTSVSKAHKAGNCGNKAKDYRRQPEFWFVDSIVPSCYRLDEGVCNDSVYDETQNAAKKRACGYVTDTSRSEGVGGN